jgi:2'-5' RNA ligase
MRLFIAVELPRPVLTAAADVSHALQARVATLAPAARLTWIPTDRMHLTIRFLGEVGTSQVRMLESAFAESLETPSFVVTLDRVGAFPARGPARVLWLGIGSGRSELVQLEREVSGRLKGLGVVGDNPPYTPHLTLARARDPRGLRLPGLLEDVAPAPSAVGLIDAITLFESRLSPKGPTYTALARTPLRPVQTSHTHL